MKNVFYYCCWVRVSSSLSFKILCKLLPTRGSSGKLVSVCCRNKRLQSEYSNLFLALIFFSVIVTSLSERTHVYSGQMCFLA